MINKGFATIHLASQYLAAAAISFLDKKDDDSHTNLGYSVSEHQIKTWPLSSTQDYLTLDLLNFSLKWVSSSGVETLDLSGKTHEKIISWIKDISTRQGLEKPYSYSLHYDLPYSLRGEEVFEINEESLSLERQLRGLAQSCIQKTLEDQDLESAIRIWPHHFDTGALAFLDENPEISIGLGLAIPDSMIDQHYFYISGYRGHESIDPSTFAELSHGKWVSDGFKGAVFYGDDLNEENVLQFFREAIRSLSRLDGSELSF